MEKEIKFKKEVEDLNEFFRFETKEIGLSDYKPHGRYYFYNKSDQELFSLIKDQENFFKNKLLDKDLYSLIKFLALLIKEMMNCLSLSFSS